MRAFKDIYETAPPASWKYGFDVSLADKEVGQAKPNVTDPTGGPIPIDLGLGDMSGVSLSNFEHLQKTQTALCACKDKACADALAKDYEKAAEAPGWTEGEEREKAEKMAIRLRECRELAGSERLKRHPTRGQWRRPHRPTSSRIYLPWTRQRPRLVPAQMRSAQPW